MISETTSISPEKILDLASLAAIEEEPSKKEEYFKELETRLTSLKGNKSKLEEDDGNLGAALASLTVSGKVDLAKMLLEIIDIEKLVETQHFQMLWGVVNQRGNQGVQDPSYLTLKNMIDAGFNIAAMERNRDLFSESVKQSYFENPTNIEVIKLLLKTKKVPGFEGDFSKQILEDLSKRNRSFVKACFNEIKKIEKDETKNIDERHSNYTSARNHITYRPSLHGNTELGTITEAEEIDDTRSEESINTKSDTPDSSVKSTSKKPINNQSNSTTCTIS